MKYLCFIGSGRTGSTFLGQVVNYHPNCLISNESRFLDKVINQSYPFDRAFQDLYQNAHLEFKNGLENTEYNMSQYQARWKDMGHLAKSPEFQKKEILVVGDKKAGGTTQIFRESPKELLMMAEKNNFYFLHLIRHPAVAARSYMKSHGYNTFEEACAKVVEDSLYAAQIEDHLTSRLFLRVYYEDFLHDFGNSISKVGNWLGIEMSNEWVRQVKQTVDTKSSEISESDIKDTLSLIGSRDEKNIFSRYWKQDDVLQQRL
jgi:hypothetical protein